MSKKSGSTNKLCLTGKIYLFIKIVLVLYLVLYFYSSLKNINNQIRDIQSGQGKLIEELGEQKQFKDIQKDILIAFSEDINTLRSYFLLPLKDYSYIYGQDEQEPEDLDSKSGMSKSLLKFFDSIGEENNIKKNKILIDGYIKRLIQDQRFIDTINKVQVVYIKEDTDWGIEIKIMGKNSNYLFDIKIPFDRDIIKFVSIKDETEAEYTDYDTFIQVIIGFIEEESTNLYYSNYYESLAQLKKILMEDDIGEVFNKKRFNIVFDIEDDGVHFFYKILNVYGEEVAKIYINKDTLQYGLLHGDDIIWYEEGVKENLLEYLQELPSISKENIVLNEKLEEFINLIKEKPFQDVLDKNNIRVSTDYIEEDDRFYFDVFDINDILIKRIILEKGSKIFKIVDPDGTNAKDLLDATNDIKKKR